MCPTRVQMTLSFLTVFFGTRQGHILVQKPFGVKMCERLCYNAVGCSSFVYARSDMACYTDGLPNMTATSVRDVWTFNISKRKDIKHNAVRGTCQKNWKIILSISQKYICLRRSPKRKNNIAKSKKSGGREVMRSMLLLMPFGTRSCQVHQMYIHNFTVKEFSFDCDKAVYAAIYIRTNKGLIIARRDGVYFSDLHGKNLTLLAKQKLCCSLSIDEHEGLLFLSLLDLHAVWLMHLNNRSMTVILKNLKFGTSLPTALDTKHQIIYVNTKLQIFSVRYDGRNKNILVCCKSFGPALAIDVTKGELYYSKGRELRKQSITTNVTTILNSKVRSLKSLAFYEEKLFVIYCNFKSSQITIDTFSGPDAKRVEYVNTKTKFEFGILAIP